MRGKPKDWIMTAWDARNIPAYAGKTCGTSSWEYFNTEHPRVCGENAGYFDVIEYFFGTSPRMRGKRPSPQAAGGVAGNIPAYAGKTF